MLSCIQYTFMQTPKTNQNSAIPTRPVRRSLLALKLGIHKACVLVLHVPTQGELLTGPGKFAPVFPRLPLSLHSRAQRAASSVSLG